MLEKRKKTIKIVGSEAKKADKSAKSLQRTDGLEAFNKLLKRAAKPKNNTK